MIFTLSAAGLILAAFLKNGTLPAVIFMAGYLLLHFVLDNVCIEHYGTYYVMAILYDWLALEVAALKAKTCKMSRFFFTCCIMSATVNAGGFLLWINYFPPGIYNNLQLLILAIALAVIARSTGGGMLRLIRDYLLDFADMLRPKSAVNFKRASK